MIFELDSLKLDAIMHMSGINRRIHLHHTSQFYDFNGIRCYFDSICNYFSMLEKKEILEVINKYTNHAEQIELWNASICSNDWTFEELMKILSENGYRSCLYFHAIKSGRLSSAEMLIMFNDRLAQNIQHSEHDNINIAISIIKSGKLSGEELIGLLGTPGKALTEMLEAAKPFLTGFIESKKLSD